MGVCEYGDADGIRPDGKPAGGGSENRSTIGGAIGVVCGCATGIIGDDMGNGDVAAAGGATGIGAEPGNGLSDGAADPPPNTC